MKLRSLVMLTAGVLFAALAASPQPLSTLFPLPNLLAFLHAL